LAVLGGLFLALLPSGPKVSKPKEVKRKTSASAPASAAPTATLSTGLSKTRDGFLGRLRQLVGSGIDADMMEDIEELLYTADIGVETTTRIMEDLHGLKGQQDYDTIVSHIKGAFLSALDRPASDEQSPEEGPRVIFVVGVNGTGKTTTIAKLANEFHSAGKKVVLVAADTFRAAAVQQLGVWADRIGTEFVSHPDGKSPSAVIFDGVSAGKGRGADVVLCDTAGRLHTKHNLMQELEKMARVADKAHPGAPHETWLVLDATTGQNALHQAKEFHAAIPLTGVVLTKLDGTAKGGVAIAVAQALNVPIRYLGIGEGLADLKPFQPQDFVDAIFAGS
jgi:fused signal recognition particle receptor